MPIQGYSPADLARLRSVQINGGRTAPRRREVRDGLRVVRLIRRPTDSGATVVTKEYYARRGDHKDVTVHVAPIRVASHLGGQR